MHISTQHFRVTGDAALADRTVGNGGPIMVCGLVVQGDWKLPYIHNFTDVNGTIILTVETSNWSCPDNITFTMHTHWIAENGLIVPSSFSTYATTVLFRPFI